jgi:hypothetical protein
MAIGQSAEKMLASNHCPQNYARVCDAYESRLCTAIFYLRGEAGLEDKTVQEILNNISKLSQLTRPSRIEIYSHYMEGSEFESKGLAKLRAKNVRSALIERGVSSKIIKIKTPVQQCVVKDDQIKQRRVEVVFS